ncbi:MAG TPA: molybdopterin molybdotransferase MoeA [Methylotenera sp.]|nr:molybdopterin molybdotransferase MoeA [Methylotenera sp.]HPV45736.1 molybdopterin molybdotransferase MoeA [Methylotenera sp.]
MKNKTTLSEIIANPSCMDDYDPNAMSVAQARLFIKQFLSPVREAETLPIRESLGRVLAEDIVSPSNVPNHNNSAMDGFAFKFSANLKTLKIIGTAFAGQPFMGNLNAGECVKIMTGAVIPAGADTVVMQERIAIKSDRITLLEETKQGANVRLAGEDLRIGQTVLTKGHLMKPADLGLVASLGIAEIPVYRKLKVAFFSTGDELVGVENPLQEGQIYDSNRYTLYGMLTRLGAQISDLGNVPDDPAQLEATLLQAAQNNDVVITSGGVSVGEADYMKALLAKHGQVLFWKMNMKPGRPLAYGKIASAHYFGLPGNPVATMVTFYQFVREALLMLQGASPKPLPMLMVECTEPIKKATGRTEYQRGVLYDDAGVWKVKPTGNQGSGILSSMSAANCFIVLDEAAGNHAAGELVKIQVLEGMI